MLQHGWTLRKSEASNEKTNTAWFHSYEVSKLVKLIETESNGGCQRLGEERNGELLFNGDKISVIQDE